MISVPVPVKSIIDAVRKRRSLCNHETVMPETSDSVKVNTKLAAIVALIRRRLDKVRMLCWPKIDRIPAGHHTLLFHQKPRCHRIDRLHRLGHHQSPHRQPQVAQAGQGASNSNRHCSALAAPSVCCPHPAGQMSTSAWQPSSQTPSGMLLAGCAMEHVINVSRLAH